MVRHNQGQANLGIPKVIFNIKSVKIWAKSEKLVQHLIMAKKDTFLRKRASKLPVQSNCFASNKVVRNFHKRGQRLDADPFCQIHKIIRDACKGVEWGGGGRGGRGVSFWWEDILLFFDWWGCRPQPHIRKNHVAQKCSQPIRLLDSFTKNFSRNAWSFQFIVFLHGSSASWLKSMKYLLVADPFWSSLWVSHKSALFFKIQN